MIISFYGLPLSGVDKLFAMSLVRAWKKYQQQCILLSRENAHSSRQIKGSISFLSVYFLKQHNFTYAKKNRRSNNIFRRLGR